MGILSKQKGKRFEKEVCKKLSLWVSGGKRTDLFVPSTGSGSLSTVHSDQKLYASHCGDVTPSDPEGFQLCNKWMIECKSYKDLEILKLFFRHIKNQEKTSPILMEFMSKAIEEAKVHKKNAMLIVKQNRSLSLCVFPAVWVENILKKSYPIVPAFFSFPHLILCSLYFMSLDDALSVDFSLFKNLRG